MKSKKTRWWKVLLTIVICLAVLAVVFLLWLQSAAKQIQNENEEAAKKLKVSLVAGVNDLEYYYGQNLKDEIMEYHEQADNAAFTEYVIYYPAELSETYPVVVWGNGSGGTYKDYETALKSLASYGFVVIGNDDSLTGSGETIYEMGLYAEKLNNDPNSIFYQKLDITHMGVGGHSQGACGAVNAATQYERSSELFSALFTTSMPKIEMCIARFAYWSYDISKVKIPYFMTSGTGSFDADTVAPLSSLQANFELLSDDVAATMAVMIGADHNIVNNYHGCGYMNAWYCYTLKGDTQAAQIFAEQGELGSNTERWSNVGCKNISTDLPAK